MNRTRVARSDILRYAYLLSAAFLAGAVLVACQPVSVRSITNTTRNPADDQPPVSTGVVGEVPVLEEESNNGYNVVRYGGRFYALPQSVGPFIPETAVGGGYVEGETLQQVRLAIAALVIAGRERDFDVDPNAPRLLWENYHGFNLVRYRQRTYALRLDGIPFDASLADASKYLTANSPSALQEVIATSGTAELEVEADKSPAIAQLVDSDVNGYNLIRFGRRTYAIRMDDGSFDVDRFSRGEYRAAHVAPSASDLRAEFGPR